MPGENQRVIEDTFSKVPSTEEAELPVQKGPHGPLDVWHGSRARNLPPQASLHAGSVHPQWPRHALLDSANAEEADRHWTLMATAQAMESAVGRRLEFHCPRFEAKVSIYLKPAPTSSRES